MRKYIIILSVLVISFSSTAQNETTNENQISRLKRENEILDEIRVRYIGMIDSLIETTSKSKDSLYNIRIKQEVEYLKSINLLMRENMKACIYLIDELYTAKKEESILIEEE